jgi:hypothetical protein
MRVRLIQAALATALLSLPISSRAGRKAKAPASALPAGTNFPSVAREVVDLYPGTDSAFATPMVKLSWHASDNAVRYQVQMAFDGDFKNLVLDRTGSELSTVAGPLRPAHYFWRVGAVDKRGARSQWSNTNEMEIRAGDAAGQATLHWRPAAWTAARFVVKIYRDKSLSGAPIQQTTTGDAFWTTGPIPKGVYWWRVETFDDDGTKLDLSRVWTFTVHEGGIVEYEID